MDARIDAAGVRDAGFYKVPGYPYLRTDRTLATIGRQVRGLHDTSEWLRRMRELDQESRDYEMRNLGVSELEAIESRDRFLNCGRVLASIELLDDPERFRRLVESIHPDDDYSSLRRFVGLYVLRRPGMLDRLDEHRRDALQRIDQARTENAPPSQIWKLQPQEDSSLLDAMPTPDAVNEIGYPGLLVSQWRALAERHAPTFWIEQGRANEGPSTPVLTSRGAGADPGQALLNYQIGFTRFRGQLVVQLTYVIWFDSGSPVDPVTLDGLIWRVTLDPVFAPLAYESVQASGADHRWYPVQPLIQRAADGVEPAFVIPGPFPASGVVLQVRSGSHEIVRVTSLDAAARIPIRAYQLRPYEDLYTLPAPAGGTRSLFGPDGLLPGSVRIDPIGGSFSGIASPGAIRQLGHHPIAHVGRLHLDDPDLLDRTFEAVPPASLSRVVALTVTRGQK